MLLLFRGFYHFYSNCSPFAFDNAPLKQAAFDLRDPLCVQEPSGKVVTEDLRESNSGVSLVRC